MQGFDALAHPFTAPYNHHLDKLQSEPGAVRSKSDDMARNGNEVGGGSIRNHVSDRQLKELGLVITAQAKP